MKAKIVNARFFATPQAFRAWLETHHLRAEELWVGFCKKASGRPSITWPESVDQALCFCWIDGVRKRLDDEHGRSLLKRFETAIEAFAKGRRA